MSMDRTEIEALLPFLANDTLDGPERDAVTEAVAADAGLRNELEALRLVRGQMQAEEMEASPGELGLARLMRDIDREAAQAAPAADTAPGNVVPLQRLRIWQVAAAMLLAVGIGQAVLTPGSGPGAPDQIAVNERDAMVDEAPMATQGLEDAGGSSFELASGNDGAASAASFRATFDPTATEAAIRGALLDAGVEIVAGPSALGLYDLAVLDGPDGVDAARASLQGADVIESLDDIEN